MQRLDHMAPVDDDFWPPIGIEISHGRTAEAAGSAQRGDRVGHVMAPDEYAAVEHVDDLQRPLLGDHDVKHAIVGEVGQHRHGREITAERVCEHHIAFVVEHIEGVTDGRDDDLGLGVQIEIADRRPTPGQILAGEIGDHVGIAPQHLPVVVKCIGTIPAADDDLRQTISVQIGQRRFGGGAGQITGPEDRRATARILTVAPVDVQPTVIARRDQLDDAVAVDVTDSNRRQEAGTGSARQGLLGRGVEPFDDGLVSTEISRIDLERIDAGRTAAGGRVDLHHVRACTQIVEVDRTRLCPERRGRADIEASLLDAVDDDLERSFVTLVREHRQGIAGEGEPGIGARIDKGREVVVLEGIFIIDLAPPLTQTEVLKVLWLGIQIQLVPAVGHRLSGPDIDEIGHDRSGQDHDLDDVRTIGEITVGEELARADATGGVDYAL